MCLKNPGFLSLKSLLPLPSSPVPGVLNGDIGWGSFEPTLGLLPAAVSGRVCPPSVQSATPDWRRALGQQAGKGRNPSLLSSLLSCSPVPHLSGRGHGYSLQDCIAVPRRIMWGWFCLSVQPLPGCSNGLTVGWGWGGASRSPGWATLSQEGSCHSKAHTCP